MLRLDKAETISSVGKISTMYFEFSYDNSSNLPINSFTMGTTIYLIGNGSIARNIKTGINYIYSNGKWIKNLNAVSPTTSIYNITNNGNYNILNNDTLGMSNIKVDVAGGGNLIEKTITENGEYLPAEDEADGYSKVVVDVDDSAHFSKIRCAIPNGGTEVAPFYLCMSNNGEYDVTFLYASLYEKVFLASPLTKMIYYDTATIIFTPSNSFDKSTAFKNKYSDSYSPIASGSANPTAGDGKIYRAVCKSFDDYLVTIAALEFTNSGLTSFNFSIT